MTNFIIISLLVSLFGCYSKDRDYNSDFVNKYNVESFTAFAGKAIYYRGVDEENDPMVFISSSNDLSNCNAPFIITFYADTDSIKSTSRHLLKDSCSIDKEDLIDLVNAFRRYKISYLKVDANQNVFINITQAGEPNLVRFSDKQFVTDKYQKGWKPINDNWYEKKK